MEWAPKDPMSWSLVLLLGDPSIEMRLHHSLWPSSVAPHRGFIIRQPSGDVVETRMWGIHCRKWVTGNTALNMLTHGTTFPVIPALYTVGCGIAVSNSPLLCISLIPFHHNASALRQLRNKSARWQWRKRNLNMFHASLSGVFQQWVTQRGHQTRLV